MSIKLKSYNIFHARWRVIRKTAYYMTLCRFLNMSIKSIIFCSLARAFLCGCRIIRKSAYSMTLCNFLNMSLYGVFNIYYIFCILYDKIIKTVKDNYFELLPIFVL